MQNEATPYSGPTMDQEKKAERMTPAHAMKILEKAGVKISLDDAELVLELLYKFANVALENLLGRIRDEEAKEDT